MTSNDQPITILGVDFTCNPSPRKPITATWGSLVSGVLTFDRVENASSPSEFQALLERPGSWVGAFDYPFGLPLAFVDARFEASNWDQLALELGGMDREEFVQRVKSFRTPDGRKRIPRPTDTAAQSTSAMNVDRPAVGKMLHLGIPCLARSGVSVVPCRLNGDERIALEGYPALVAREFIGRRSYKYEGRHPKSSQLDAAREELIAALTSDRARVRFGFAVDIDPIRDQLRDASADVLDSVLCGIKAAWACDQRNYGIPIETHPIEGWIIGTGHFGRAIG